LTAATEKEYAHSGSRCIARWESSGPRYSTGGEPLLPLSPAGLSAAAAATATLAPRKTYATMGSPFAWLGDHRTCKLVGVAATSTGESGLVGGAASVRMTADGGDHADKPR